jgi:5-formyltetrahydrofolate cyclo-ligase
MASKMIGCYLPMNDEVDPTNIIERAWCANKRVFVPVTDTHGAMNFSEITPDTVVTRNHYGIWEPLSGTCIGVKQLDVVITPMAAFDAAKNRIGMGGGYFDRCFHFLRNRCKWLSPKLLGVAFEFQRVEMSPPDTWEH